jgi:hypothetical protein
MAKPRSPKKVAKKPSVEDWRARSARRQGWRWRRILRDAAEFERHLAHCRQTIAESPDIPAAEKRRLSQLSDSEFKMWLAEQHQQQKLRKPTRHDPYDERVWLPGNDSF